MTTVKDLKKLLKRQLADLESLNEDTILIKHRDGSTATSYPCRELRLEDVKVVEMDEPITDEYPSQKGYMYAEDGIQAVLIRDSLGE